MHWKFSPVIVGISYPSLLRVLSLYAHHSSQLHALKDNFPTMSIVIVLVLSGLAATLIGYVL